MKVIPAILIIFLALFIVSCERNDNTPEAITQKDITGYIQKGPYLNGSSVSMSELTSALAQTGKTFSSTSKDNNGSFIFPDISLSSPFVELKADGFYFNEITNENSAAQLTLFAISDLEDNTDLNINVLTNLEKDRVEFLVKQGVDFHAAKSQAQSEILSIFNITPPVGIKNSEYLNISLSGENNAILLAVSMILQGHLSVADLSELMANISTDIREDGELNSADFGSVLINNAKSIDMNTIRQNLQIRNKQLGINSSVPEFENYVNGFINNTNFVYTSSIDYPANGYYGVNILDRDKTIYDGGHYSFNAIVPDGNSLKVKVSGNNWGFYEPAQTAGWIYTSWNNSDSSRIFSSTRSGEIDMDFQLFSSSTYNFDSLSMQTDTIQVKTYTKISVFENNVTEPTWEKTITVN